jgi:hypothetical protein
VECFSWGCWVGCRNITFRGDAGLGVGTLLLWGCWVGCRHIAFRGDDGFGVGTICFLEDAGFDVGTLNEGDRNLSLLYLYCLIVPGLKYLFKL